MTIVGRPWRKSQAHGPTIWTRKMLSTRKLIMEITPMTSDFFKKVESEKAVRREAAAQGRKMGLPQDFGVFYGPDAPAHLKNALSPLPTEAEWEAEMQRDLNDPIRKHFGSDV